MSFLVNREVDEGYFRKTNAWSGRITVSSTLMGGRAVDSPEIASIPSVLRHEATNLGCKHSAQIDFSAKNKKNRSSSNSNYLYLEEKSKQSIRQGPKKGEKITSEEEKISRAEQNQDEEVEESFPWQKEESTLLPIFHGSKTKNQQNPSDFLSFI